MGSTNGRFLLGILLGLLCGGGLFHLLDEPAPVGATETIELTPGVPAVVHDEIDERDLPTGAAISGRELARPIPESALRSAQVSNDDVAELVAGLGDLGKTSSMGNGTIHGRVTDEKGQGVAGVVVRSTGAGRRSRATSSSKVGMAAPEQKSLEEAVREAATRYQETQGALREATTDTTGAYRIERLSDREWSLHAYLEGYRITPEVSSSRVSVGSEVNFDAERVMEVPVQVVEASGAPATTAILRARRKGPEESSQSYGWSPEAAFLRLVPGKYELTAYSGESTYTGEAERNSESQDVTITAEGTPASLRFELRGRLGIRGMVKVTKGDPTSTHMIVRSMPLSPQQDVDLETLGDSDSSTWVQPGSEFKIADLEPGRYAVGVARSWSSPITAHRVVEVTTGFTRCDLELPPIDRSRTLSITVLDPNGEMLDDVDFHLSVKRGNSTSSSGENPLVDDTGVYLLTLDGENAEAYFDKSGTNAKFTLQISHDDYGSRKSDLTRGQTDLTVTFSVPGTLEVTIAGYVGSDYEGRLSVNASKRRKPGESASYSFDDGSNLSTEGVKEITGLEPGAYTITLRVRPKGSSRRSYSSTTIDSIDIDILPGPNSIQLSIPALYSLRVYWPDGKEEATMSMSTEREANMYAFGNNNAKVDAQGYAEFNDLRAGNYTLRTWGGDIQQMRITIPSKDVEFAPMKIDALLVKITDETGDLAKLGFRDNDLVIGMGGKEFEKSPDFSALVKLQTSKSATETFLVLRNGKQLEISATGSDIGDWSDLGGQLLPTQR